MRRGWWLLLAALLAAPSAAGVAPGRPFPLPPPALQEAGELLGSRDPAEVQRGLERLGALGTPRALDLLVRALAGGAAARGPERVIAVHALARHAAKPAARAALVQALQRPAGEDGDPSAERARAAAALALAGEGGDQALAVLFGALGQGGEVQAAALEALRRFPPRTLPLAALRTPGAAGTLAALRALGDLRLLPTFRQAVRSGDVEARRVAALGLAELGDRTVVPLVARWSRAEAPALQLAALELALSTGEPADEARWRALAAAPATREAALALALRHPRPALAPALEAELERAPAPAARAALALALARAGSPGLAALERSLRRPRPGPALAALALTPGPAVGAALARALASPVWRGLAARAATLHALRHGVEVPGRVEALRALAASRDPHHRATVAWCGAVLAPLAALPRLEGEREPALRSVRALALLDARARARASRELLAELVEEAPAPGAELAPGACLGGWALAARAEAPAELLEGAVGAAPTACVIAGLADNRAPGLLAAVERRWALEERVEVRRALVAVVAARRGAARQRLLARLAALDPDAQAAAAARWALLTPDGAGLTPPGAAVVTALLVGSLDPAAAGPGGGAVAARAGAPHQPPVASGLAGLTMLDSGAW